MDKEEQVINIFIRGKKINSIQKRFNLSYKTTRSHITLVYPFKGIDQKRLYNHIKTIIKNRKRFSITLSGFQKSAKDYYLYMLINQGKKEILELYKKLNSEILSKFKNQEMPVFIPHITLGIFSSKKDIDDVLNNLKKEKMIIKSEVKEINLLTLNPDHSIKNMKKFKLK